MEVLQYWKIVRRRLWIILLLCLMGILSALWYTSVQPPVYDSTAVLIINPGVPSSLIPFMTPAEAEASTTGLAATYVRYLKTRSFAQLVSARLGGMVDPEIISHAISAHHVASTRFFEITAVASSPELAQMLANTAAEVFVVQSPQHQPEEADPYADQLRSQLDYFSQRVNEYQALLDDLRLRPLTSESQTLVEQTEDRLAQAQDNMVKILSALTTAGGSAGRDTAAIVDPADLPVKAAQADTAQNLVFALVSSLALGVGLTFLLEYLDTAVTVRRPEDLGGALGLPLLGVVGVLEQKSSRRDLLVTVSHPKSPNAEAYHSIAANLKLSKAFGGMRTLLVTSAGPGEGKTVSAANLAVTLAEGGDRVVVVDADLRRPTLQKHFLAHNTIGLSNLLMDSTLSVKSVLLGTEVSGLFFLPSGPLPPLPQTLLSLPRMNEILAELRQLADVVVLDSPPVMAVADPLVLSNLVDGVVLVAMAGRTNRDLLDRTRESLANVGATLVGTVLNRVRSADLGSYHLYYYYRHHRQLADGGESEKTRLVASL